MNLLSQRVPKKPPVETVSGVKACSSGLTGLLKKNLVFQLLSVIPAAVYVFYQISNAKL